MLVGTFSAEYPLRGSGVAGLVVAGVALAVRVVVDLHAGRMRVERVARLLVEALLSQLFCWNENRHFDTKLYILYTS